LKVVVSDPVKEGEQGQEPSEDAARSRDKLAEPMYNRGFLFDVAVGSVDGVCGFAAGDGVVVVLLKFDAEHFG
jgi:hypothetical protein